MTPVIEEQVIIVDAKNEVVGSARRSHMRAHNLHHRATYIFVFCADGRLCVQERSQDKDIYPGYFDPACGGVLGENEEYDECAERELEEELGKL